MKPTRTAGVVVATALATGTVVGCSTTFTDGVRPGVAQAGGSGTLDSPAHRVVVQLPLGPLTLEIGRPKREIEAVDGDGRAADGATWVPIAWTLGGNGADYENDVPAFQFQVTLIADGRRYGLQAAQAGDSDQAATKYTPVVKEKALDVVVQGRGQHLAAEVEYDGVTQRVDFDSEQITAGRAAPLYRNNAQQPRLARSACPVMSTADARRFSMIGGTACTVGAVRTTPYVGGIGWVGSAKETWTLVPLDLHLFQIEANEVRTRYSHFDVRELSITVDGVKPTTEILRYRDHDSLSYVRGGVLVFRTSSAPKTLEVNIAVRCQNEYRLSQFHTFRGSRTYQLSQ